MKSLYIKTLSQSDEEAFLSMTQQSRDFHHPWVSPPLTTDEFLAYYQRSQASNQKNYVLFQQKNIVGVLNVSEIVRGAFQSAFLGFYIAKASAGKGFMAQGLQLVLTEIFTTLNLHRVEANIQPGNTRSLALVKKNGFRKEGFSLRYLNINNQWCDHERWAMTIEDWQAQGRQGCAL